MIMYEKIIHLIFDLGMYSWRFYSEYRPSENIDIIMHKKIIRRIFDLGMYS